MSASANQVSYTRPEIKIEDGELPQQIDQAIAALAARKDLFVFGDQLCCIHVTDHEETGIVSRPAGAAKIIYPDATLLTEKLTAVARWIRYDRRIGGYRECNAPVRYGHHILARKAWPEFPRINGIIECPTFWRGRIIDKPGLHEASGLYLTARPKGYRPPPEQCSFVNAERALEQLLEVISTFPVETDADRSAFASGIITAVIRRALPAAPALAYDANLPGSGKTIAARLTSTVAIGRAGSVISLTGDKSEDEKRLGAALLAGDPVIIVDNIPECEVESPLMCSMVTESEVSVRVLGQSCNVKVPTNALIILTGNNLQITRDLRRRVLLMRLNAGVERPEERTFGRDPVAYVLEHRGSLIRSVLTIVKAYYQAGSPSVGLRPFGGFEEWDLAVRRPLVWLGQPDPLLPSQGLREIDPDIQTTRALFSAWASAFGIDGATCAHALRTARKSAHRFDGEEEPSHPELRDAIQAAIGDKLDSRALSRWLRRHRDRILDGLTLHQGTDAHAKVARWTVCERGVMRG